MRGRTNLTDRFLNRPVLVTFVVLLGFYLVANFVFETTTIPFEPAVESFFSGYWAVRQYVLVGGFALQLLLSWAWLFVYAYLVALTVGSGYRYLRQ